MLCLTGLQASMASIIAPEPTVQTASFNAGPGGCDEIVLTFTPGDGSRRLIVASANVPVSTFPVDGQGYSAGSLFGTGSNLGNSNYVVYGGSGSMATITGLDGGVEYHFAIFEFNGTGSNSNYLLTAYPEASAIAAGFTMTIFSTSGAMCIGDSVKLEVHGAETYSWAPSGSLSSNSDSIVWAKPTATTAYSATGMESLSGCSDVKIVTITVYNLPNVNFHNLADHCINAGTVVFTGSTPSGGTYTGIGVTGNQFNPVVAGVGTHTIRYTYTDIHGCTDYDDEDIDILDAPNATFSTLPAVCVDAAPFALTGGNPSGGVYSGTGVASGQFSPAVAGVGQFTISYIYTNNDGCSDTATRSQKVNAKPSVSFATLSPICLNSPPVNLSGGTPSGGTYSGNGVNNGQFSPLVSGAGSFELTYTYSDSAGCSGEDTSVLIVHTLPAVGFSSLSPVCQNTGPVALSGGSPAGGSYSGIGVGGGIFYTGIAGAGQHTITYSYSNANNCTNSATQQMTVNPIPHPNLGNDVVVCSDEAVHLSGGSFTSYSWSTGGNSSSVDIDSTGHGIGTFPVVLTVTNNFGCANKDTVLVTFDVCSGLSFPASVNEGVLLYPNPFDSKFYVMADEQFSMEIFDLKGSRLFQRENLNSYESFGEDLPSGSYILRIEKKNSIIHRLIIRK